MAATRPTRKDSVDVLLDKINHMWEELLTIERALERMQNPIIGVDAWFSTKACDLYSLTGTQL